MILPNACLAFVDENKLSGYCLNRAHPKGRHKARIFAAFGIFDSAILKSLLLEAAISEPAQLERSDCYGALYSVDFYFNNAFIKSIWMIRKEEDFPRLITCYIAQKS